MRTLYYYQTFIGLEPLMTHLTDIDIINVSSIHFDKDSYGNCQIYLNDNLPDSVGFNVMWREIQQVSVQGVTTMLMIGGAGGAFTTLFQNFEACYPQLRELLQNKSYLSGVDLDVEESISLNDIQMLIRCLKRDFPYLKLSMAPIASSLETDFPGMGGFSYKHLLNSKEGQMIDWWNVQCYDDFSCDTLRRIVKNGYPPDSIHMGMMSGQFPPHQFSKALDTVSQMLHSYHSLGGVFVWEYIDAPPDTKDPSQWCHMMSELNESLWVKGGDAILE